MEECSFAPKLHKKKANPIKNSQVNDEQRRVKTHASKQNQNQMGE